MSKHTHRLFTLLTGCLLFTLLFVQAAFGQLPEPAAEPAFIRTGEYQRYSEQIPIVTLTSGSQTAVHPFIQTNLFPQPLSIQAPTVAAPGTAVP